MKRKASSTEHLLTLIKFSPNIIPICNTLQYFPSESRHDGCRVEAVRPFNSQPPPTAERSVSL
ncbi:hypothetical protein IGS61_17955 [Janthinobacterium sp. FW305-129]|uniref:hypothetical protein n=1 Tax=Janthinobacterium sp. FW305-129 TaxID=2775054 RepID=UPI001E447C7A|nr:hypothetical protein [Janthinobacterium sp. FW305-129]MCC7599378.1 hypothetical protein [Janthinobacterium sp. FW305-129]